ncbi:MAG: hypothetical protein ACRDQU_18940 [Pseudonocardiaceae bacterium]
MKLITNRGSALRRPLAVLVAAAGLTVGGCANNPTIAPGAQSTAPSPPAPSSTSPAQMQAATLTWAKSFCQALKPVFGQLGTPPRPDLNNPDATRQSLVNYLGNARNATEQAIDRVSAIGPPPVENGMQVLTTLRIQLIALRDNLNNAVTQLDQADPNDSGAISRAFGAAGNVVGLLGTLTTDPQLRAAINQSPECQSLSAANPTNQPTGSSQPPG